MLEAPMIQTRGFRNRQTRRWSGYLSSEYEGDYAAGRAADQLRRQHALLRSF
jgi:hypothetical protein